MLITQVVFIFHDRTLEESIEDIIWNRRCSLSASKCLAAMFVLTVEGKSTFADLLRCFFELHRNFSPASFKELKTTGQYLCSSTESTDEQTLYFSDQPMSPNEFENYVDGTHRYQVYEL